MIGTDLGLYHILHQVIPYSLAKTVSFICGAVVAFFLNKYWTFEQRKKSFGEIIRFAFANLSALGLNVLTNHGMLHLIGASVLAAVITATAVATVFLFFVFKFWVFK